MNNILEKIISKKKSIAKLIDSGLIVEQTPLVLKYRGQKFKGKARRGGIELTDGMTYAPSVAAIRCYASAGYRRPSESGWRVWKTAKGKTLNQLFEKLQAKQKL
jgi:hypothetical protein